jgi:hypothetical protein
VKSPSKSEPASPGHRASDIARGVAPPKPPLVIGKGDEHGLSPHGSAFKEARHGVRKAGPENPKNK